MPGIDLSSICESKDGNSLPKESVILSMALSQNMTICHLKIYFHSVKAMTLSDKVLPFISGFASYKDPFPSSCNGDNSQKCLKNKILTIFFKLLNSYNIDS